MATADSRHLVLRGTVAVGEGAAAKFLSMPGYRKGFRDKIGYVPYPGTLNVRLFPSYVRKVSAIRKRRGILVKGFSVGGRSYGGVNCYEAVVNGRLGAFVIRPKRSRYPASIVELVSRKRLKGGAIRGGATVSIGVRLA